jgi:AraC-like DNA-binding protein
LITRGALGDGRFEFATREPCALLRPYVRSLVGFDEFVPRPQTRRQFPEPFVVMIVEFGPPLRVTMGDDARTAARHELGFVAGLGDVFADTEHERRQRGVQVDLTAAGARRFFGIPLSQIAGRVVALRDLLPEGERNLAQQLDAASGWPARLDRVEALLERRIFAARVDSARVDWAVSRIESSAGRIDVGSLARELGCSRKHLIALFHDQVGAPPKLLASLVRFERAMRAARDNAAFRWSDLALAHGYYDQSHLAREVRRFTGLTPTQARNSFASHPPAPVNFVQDAPRARDLPSAHANELRPLDHVRSPA